MKKKTPAPPGLSWSCWEQQLGPLVHRKPGLHVIVYVKCELGQWTCSSGEVSPEKGEGKASSVRTHLESSTSQSWLFLLEILAHSILYSDTLNSHQLRLALQKYWHQSQIHQSMYVFNVIQMLLLAPYVHPWWTVHQCSIQHRKWRQKLTGNAVAAAKGELWMGRTSTAVNGKAGWWLGFMVTLNLCNSL